MSYLFIFDVLIIKQHSQIWMTSQNCIILRQDSSVFIYLCGPKNVLICSKEKNCTLRY